MLSASLGSYDPQQHLNLRSLLYGVQFSALLCVVVHRMVSVPTITDEDAQCVKDGAIGYFCSVFLECHFAPSRNRPAVHETL
jgi:hypothetical protein